MTGDDWSGPPLVPVHLLVERADMQGAAVQVECVTLIIGKGCALVEHRTVEQVDAGQIGIGPCTEAGLLRTPEANIPQSLCPRSALTKHSRHRQTHGYRTNDKTTGCGGLQRVQHASLIEQYDRLEGISAGHQNNDAWYSDRDAWLIERLV